MDHLTEKFARLGTDFAPGQEGRQKQEELPIIGEKLDGPVVDFSHGDVDAHQPIPGSLETFVRGYAVTGTHQAYTEYRGKGVIRQYLAEKLAEYSGAPVDAESEIILTPGTQGALFLAMGSLISRGDKVAIIEPDYFANRKLVYFFGGELVPVQMNYTASTEEAGLDLAGLEEALKQGVKVILHSNPNNPTGVIYSAREVKGIADLAKKYGATVIADQLYSRQIFDNHPYTHFSAVTEEPENCISIIGPSKTESLSGFRLGVAFGSKAIVHRMEKLQAIVTLRCSGYNQAVFKTWFNEPEGFMADRVAKHQAIRDELVSIFRSVEGVEVRPSEGGSYLFPKLPKMAVDMPTFVKILREQANVVVTPGTEFGPQFTDRFRINFSQDPQAAADAVRRICELIERYRHE